MAVIKNISKLVVPAYNKGPKDVIDYINTPRLGYQLVLMLGLVEYPGTFGSYQGEATNGPTGFKPIYRQLY